nr:DUF4230 domain-containing protein [Mycobacterium sp. E3298]
MNKEMVVKSLNNVHQLVGLEGHTEKTYTYTDSIFEKSGWLKDHIGRRTIQYTVDAYFKTGIDLSSIKTEDVRVYGNSVFVSLPKTTLVSLDVPYDEIVFKTQTGLIRNPLSETEKQQLYTEIRKLVSGEIMSDKRIEGKTQIGVKDALDGLLEKIPNVNRVVFRFK